MSSRSSSVKLRLVCGAQRATMSRRSARSLTAGAQALVVHALVVAAAAVRLVEQAAALGVLRRGGERKKQRAAAG